MLYKALFIDIDDTLLDFKASSQVALKNTFETLNQAYDQSVFDAFYKIDQALWTLQKKGEIHVAEILKLRFQRLLTSLHITADSSIFQSTFQDFLGKSSVLEENTLETLSYLSKKYPLFVASNGLLETQISRLKEANLAYLFTDFFVSDAIGYEKPNPLFFEECLRISGFKNTDVLFIGDSLEADISGSINVGIDTCWYNPKKMNPPADLPIKFTVSNLKELLNIL